MVTEEQAIYAANLAESINYYTPTLEELHIGYECEINRGIFPGLAEGWYKFTISRIKDYEYLKYGNIFRTKYLDREDIESLGFVKTEYTQYYQDAISLEIKEEGIIYKHDTLKIGIYIPLYLTHFKNLYHIELHNNEDYSDRNTLYNLSCKSINEFKQILKLINI